MKVAAASSMSERLAEVLSTWKTWPMAMLEPPRLVKPLSKGRTNQSYLIEINCRNSSNFGIGLPMPPRRTRLSLRLNSVNSRQFGIDRDWEQTVLEALEPFNLAPRMWYRDKEREFTLFEYLEGRIWTRNDFARLSQREKLTEHIKQIQRISLKAPRYNYLDHVKQYEQVVLAKGMTFTPGVQQQLDIFKKELYEFMLEPWQPVLCHHDLIPENVLETENGLQLLDWEYSGLGHPNFDERHMRQCINGAVQRSPESLLKGDILDKLIYWLAYLWHRLNTGK